MGGHGDDAFEGFKDGRVVRFAIGVALHIGRSTRKEEWVLERVQLFKRDFPRLVGYGTL